METGPDEKPSWTTIKELAEKYASFVLDCDGVVWQGENQIHDSFKVVEWLEN
jgi:ribonucleotide monophosphatase NagD (HAD superfamily)